MTPGKPGRFANIAEIQQVFLEHRQVYGSPCIHAVLKKRGISCSRKRVVRLMQQLGLSAGRKRSRKPTTQSDPRARFAPNPLSREFTASEPKSKWGTDTKAVETAEGWLYLAVILDPFSRMVVGWSMAATKDEQLVELARLLVIAQQQPPAGLLHHSDRGSLVYLRPLSGFAGFTGNRGEYESNGSLL